MPLMVNQAVPPKHAAGWLAVLAGVVLVPGCGGRGPEPAQIVVTVTLTRSGPAGPTLDHVPQQVETVIAVDAAGNDQTATTNGNGRARLSVLAGEYDVTTRVCPNDPQLVRAVPGTVVRLSIECLAP